MRLIFVRGAAGLLARVVSSWRRTRISCLASVRVRFHGFPSCVELFVENCSQELLRYLPPNNHVSVSDFTY
jgi:ribosomal protein L32E